MNTSFPHISPQRNAVRIGALVQPDSSLAEIQTLGGNLLPTDRLGPGVVQEVAPAGEIFVHWVGANVDSWVYLDDLKQVSDAARLVSVYTFDKLGRNKSSRHHVVKGVGLRYNWVVEVRPHNVLRTMRAGGEIWTFEWYPIFNEVHPIHTMLLEGCQMNDDQAEALTVAEIAVNSK